MPSRKVLDWLLDEDQPAIRYRNADRAPGKTRERP